MEDKPVTKTITIDDDKYEGEVNDKNQPHGKGKMIFKTGGYHDGYWKDGMPYGYGVTEYSDGEIREGYWEGATLYEGYWEGGTYRKGKATIFKDFCGETCEGKYTLRTLKDTKTVKKIPLDNTDNIFLQNINDHNIQDKPKFTQQQTKKNKMYVNMAKGEKLPKEDFNKKDHLKIMYSDHGDRYDSYLDKPICDLPNANGRKSYYISNMACHGRFIGKNDDLIDNFDDSDDFVDESSRYNLIDKIKDNIKGTNAIGFFSHVDEKYTVSFKETMDKNGNIGSKRTPHSNSEQRVNVNDEYFNTHKDEFFHYYCIINEGGTQNVYKIPHKLCYWREALIDDTNTSDPNKYPNKFMEALDNLKQGKPFTFKTRAQVDVGDKLEEKDDVEIEISGKAKMADVVMDEYGNMDIKTVQSKNQYISNVNSIYNNEDDIDASDDFDALGKEIKEDIDENNYIINNNNKDISDEIGGNVEEMLDGNVGDQQLLNRYNFTTSNNINTENAENNTITNRRNGNDLPNH